jgi:hypothetical protein
MSPSSSLLMSYFDALNRTKATAEPENAQEGDATPCTDDDDVPATQKEEGEEVVVVVGLRTPGSFDFGDHGGDLCVKRWVRELSIHLMSVCSGTCGSGCS